MEKIIKDEGSEFCEINFYFLIARCMLSLISLYFGMSILFIGEHSRSHPQNAFLLNHQLEQMQRAKRIRQQRYRLDLQRQVKQKNERRHQQRMRDIETDKKYEQVFYQHLLASKSTNPYLRYYTEQKEDKNKKNKQRYQQIKFPETDKPRRKQWLPSLKTETANIERYNKYNPQENDYFQPKLRVNTQNMNYKSNIFNDYPQVEDPQVRLQRLRNFQNSKINEVYEMMQKSIKALNQEQEIEIQQLPSRMKPIKIELNNTRRQKFKNRWHNNFNNSKQAFYRLPTIHRSFNNKALNRAEKNSLEDGMNWRQWYAKEKLKQLQTIYKRQLMNEQVKSRLQNYHSRSVTPRFYHSRYR